MLAKDPGTPPKLSPWQVMMSWDRMMFSQLKERAPSMTAAVPAPISKNAQITVWTAYTQSKYPGGRPAF